MTSAARSALKHQAGTDTHRLCCSKSTPVGGWTSYPAAAALAVKRIGARRLHILQTTGLLTLRLPALEDRDFDSFTWSSGPPDLERTDARWFIDGSQINGKWKQLSTCGVSIAVVADDGQLLAHGQGIPPSWVDSAAGAELWALCTVLHMTTHTPRVVTDWLPQFA